jgi:serine protease
MGGGGVWIAIIDTGFEYSDSNTSLRNYELTRYNPITNSYSGLFRNIVSYDFVRGSYNVYANEDSWHGTHSAVMAAGARGNNYGTAGVAPAANLMLFRIGYSKSMLAYAARAVQTANAWGADVISMSFSANAPGCTDWASNFLYELRRAESASIVNVASAGNNNAPFDKACHTWGNYPIPAAYREVIAVGAHDRALNRSVWNDSGSSASNYGPMVEIWAPGGGSRNQPGYIDLRLYSTPTPNQTFCWSNNRCANEAVSSVNRPFQYSGTSAAAPQIAGIAALMKQVNPAVTTAQARHVLITTGRRDSSHAHVTVRADAAAALRNLGAK